MTDSQLTEYVLPAVTIGLLILVLILYLAGIESLGGFPLLDSGESAVGFLAAGNFSVGIFAVGTFAVGIFAAGIFSIGIFSIGIFSIGIVAVGLYSSGVFGQSSSEEGDRTL